MPVHATERRQASARRSSVAAVASMPLTKRPVSSVENRLASSTAS